MGTSLGTFESRSAAAAQAASDIQQALEAGLAAHAEVTFGVTGGSTPVELYQLLSHSTLDWSRVRLFLSDERCVAADHPDSNAGLIRRELMNHQAAAASLLLPFEPGLSQDLACVRMEAELNRLPWPAPVSLLGMGEDGHIASLFPDAVNLEQGLDPNCPQSCIPVITSASRYPRLSLTLSALLRSEEILLLFFGEKKLRVFEAAQQARDNYPVSSLLHQDRVPVRALWAA